MSPLYLDIAANQSMYVCNEHKNVNLTGINTDIYKITEMN